MPIRKAVFPVAGLGTRFLPATKANPKEMLTVVDKPLIQYAVEEAVAAGVNELIIVTNSSKRAIEDHFDSNYELESVLESRGHHHLLNIVRNILPEGVSCAYIRQSNPLGLGHAVLCAKNLIGNEPFAVLLADDLIENERENNCLAKMAEIYQKTGCGVIGVEEVPREDTNKYGIVGLDPNDHQNLRIQTIVEKPAPNKAPSNLAVVGRYILTPQIFSLLEQTYADNRGEIQLTDAISKLLQRQDIYAYLLEGARFDCGSKLGYLQATVHYALRHPEVAEEFSDYLRQLIRYYDKEGEGVQGGGVVYS